MTTVTTDARLEELKQRMMEPLSPAELDEVMAEFYELVAAGARAHGPKEEGYTARLARLLPELAALPNWVAYKMVPSRKRPGKTDKKPVNPHTGKLAKADDSATWAAFDQAAAFLAQRPKLDGLGFQLGESPKRKSGIVGVDLDNCIDGAGNLAPWAAEIVARLDSYTEVSPSGAGIRLFCRGELPEGGRKRGDIEMYDCGRFLTVTGNAHGAPRPIRESTAELAAVHAAVFGERRAAGTNGSGPATVTPTNLDDAELLEIARNASNGAKFDRLWRGGTDGHGGDHSAADQALCNHLAFWTGNDAARIDQLFRQSGLMRDKWDERHFADGRTYGAATIEKAIANNTKVYDPARRAASANGTGRAQASVPPGQGDQDTPPGPDGEPAQGWTVALANAICANNHFARSEAGELHYWKGGVYRRGGKQRIARLCKELLSAWGRPDVFTSYRAGEVAHFIAADAPELWTRPPADKLNVRNGLLDLTKPETPVLLPHDPAWLSTIQLPVDYDPEAEPDQWLRFISDWFPKDAQRIPWELLAYLIAIDIALQKAVLLLGNGENGKSRFLAALKAFLGPRNVAALSLHQMEGSRWATHHLNGKLANICPDLPATGLDTTSVFKAITGGDMVPAEKKHGELYEYMPFVRLLFSANQPPQSRDASRAFFRRWIVVPFDATFSPAVKLPEQEIDALLAAPRQLSGALNMALRALPDVRRRGIVETESMREAHRQFHEVTDPVHVWLETNLVELPEAYIVKGDLLKAYNQAARANGNPPLTAQQFGRAVSEWRPQLQDGQKRIADARPLVWYGIGLKSDVQA